MRTHHTITLLTAAGLLALTGCSSDSSDPAPDKSEAAAAPSPKVDPERANLDKAVRAYSAAYFKPDGKAAYAALSKRCQTKAGGDPDMFSIIVDNAAKAYGKQDIQSLTIDQLAGDMARVSYTYAVPKLNQSSQPWAREDGTWRYDGC
jgi:hypothetical protein